MEEGAAVTVYNLGPLPYNPFTNLSQNSLVSPNTFSVTFRVTVIIWIWTKKFFWVIVIILYRLWCHNIPIYRYVHFFAEFQANILYSPSVIDPADRLTFVLFGENVFTVDSVLAKVNSFEGVKSADVYILTKWQYYDNWIMKEVDERLLPRPLSRRSIKVVEALKM